MKNKVSVGPKTDGSTAYSPNPQTQCRLFSLPPELRNEIYMLVFAVPINDSGRVRLSDTHHTPDKPPVLSILQTCRLLRDEAEDLFYNKHHLEIGNRQLSVHDIRTFMKSTNAHRLGAIRTLTVLVADIECVTKFFRMSRALTSLSSLTVSAGRRNLRPQNAYHRKDMAREIPMLSKVVKFLPVSLSYFRFRLIGKMQSDNYPGERFEEDIVTEESQAVEIMVIASIAHRGGFKEFISNLNRVGVPKYNAN